MDTLAQQDGQAEMVGRTHKAQISVCAPIVSTVRSHSHQPLGFYNLPAFLSETQRPKVPQFWPREGPEGMGGIGREERDGQA